MRWFCLCFFLPVSVFADAVFLKNGRVFTGKIAQETGTDVTLISGDSRERHGFRRNEILRILYKDKIDRKFIYLASGAVKHAFIVDENARSITLRLELETLNEEIVSRDKILSISEKELKTTSLPYTFSTQSRAASVAIEGEFTAWQTVAMEADKSSEGRWVAVISIDILKKSEYEYRFVVDGKTQEMRSIRFTAENEKLVEVSDKIRWRISFAAGIGTYAGGFAPNLTVLQPVLDAGVSFRLPFLPEPAETRFDLVFFRDRPNDETLPFFSGLNTETMNFITLYSFCWKIALPGKWTLSPALGGGAVFQNTETRGFRNAHVTNILGAAAGRLTLGYQLTRRLTLTLPLLAVAEFDSRITWLGSVFAGVEFAL